MSLVVGVDPDAERHGIAVYRDGKLVELAEWSLVEVMVWIGEQETKPVFGIENVLANNFVYRRNKKRAGGNSSISENIALKTGRNQQSQAELMRMLDHMNIRYRLFSPTKENWAKNKPLFERFTGWKGRSNADTRSASYFGFLVSRGS